MKQALVVGIGGFIGSVARYQLGGAILHHATSWRFPLSTFCINVLGCFAIGALAGLGERHSFLTAEMRLFVFTGVLGGFTTFSAFGAEGVNLLRRGDVAIGCAYAALSVVCGFAAVWLGLRLFGVSLRQH